MSTANPRDSRNEVISSSVVPGPNSGRALSAVTNGRWTSTALKALNVSIRGGFVHCSRPSKF